MDASKHNFGDTRGDGYIFTGMVTKAGKSYQQWRSPEAFAKRRLKNREGHRVAKLSPEKLARLRKSTSRRNADRRRLKGDHINALRRERYALCQEKILSRNVAWRKANWGKILQSRRKPQYSIASKLRVRVLRAVKDQRARKSAPTEELVGCGVPRLVSHLEAQFKPGMSWSNHGKWHIDHIRPCSSYDLTLPSQQRECFHYTNLQPLWGKENLRKGSKTPS